MLENLSVPDLLTAMGEGGLLKDHGVRQDAERLALLPDRLVEPALRAWLGSSAPRWTDVLHLEALLSARDADTLLEMLRAVTDSSVKRELAVIVWRVAPERAVEEAVAAIADVGTAAAEHWVRVTPRAHLPRIVAALQARDERPTWLAPWAGRNACHGGAAAEALFALARASEV